MDFITLDSSCLFSDVIKKLYIMINLNMFRTYSTELNNLTTHPSICSCFVHIVCATNHKAEFIWLPHRLWFNVTIYFRLPNRKRGTESRLRLYLSFNLMVIVETLMRFVNEISFRLHHFGGTRTFCPMWMIQKDLANFPLTESIVFHEILVETEFLLDWIVKI